MRAGDSPLSCGPGERTMPQVKKKKLNEHELQTVNESAALSETPPGHMVEAAKVASPIFGKQAGGRERSKAELASKVHPKGEESEAN